MILIKDHIPLLLIVLLVITQKLRLIYRQTIVIHIKDILY